jgi:hypothetical protein
MKRTLNNYIKISLLVIVLSAVSCKKFLDVQQPHDVLVGSAVFADSKSAASALVGIYSSMMQTEQGFSGNMTIDCGLYADEFTNSNPANLFVNSKLTSDYSEVNNVWVQIYNYIYGANAVLEGVTASKNIPSATGNQLIGEAKFIRAFCYFYLVNLYGDVPLVTSTSYQTNSTLARTSSIEIYQQIVADLTEAQNLLATDYSFSNGEKVRPNKWAATALLARVYLYTQQWADAETQATMVIGNATFSLPSLASAYLKNNTQAIWQLIPVNTSYNTYEAQSFIPFSSSSAVSYPLLPSFIQSFEAGDKRLGAWIGTATLNGQTYYYPSKYKIISGAIQEYYGVLGLPEQYLIRAEARAQQTNLPGAITDVNVIRARAGLTGIAANSNSAQAMAAIAHERRIELFAEWGHRWFDLKRTGQANAVIGTLKPGSWQAYSINWPVPVIQINANPALTQNPGYN